LLRVDTKEQRDLKVLFRLVQSSEIEPILTNLFK
jgi:hypothetical protein